jgi:hypothetical protein
MISKFKWFDLTNLMISKFKWFGLTNLHSQAEFTIKNDGLQSAVQRKLLKLKNPIHPYLTLAQQKRTKYKREKFL